MNTIDLTPLYRNTIGYDRLASLINSALSTDSVPSGYPPYNIEMVGDNEYAITLAVAGFDQQELEIQVERGVLIVKGSKAKKDSSKYLYQGIAHRSFERKFDLAEYVEVKGAELNNGLLTVHLIKQIPDSMKPKSIAIQSPGKQVLEHQKES
ncbi:Hsp20 family protein [Vibrio sp.]|uniref:Hsp20 family protein n=1 Tax=Vibrio sp. TaxID=678 RepID=UPI003D09DBBF